MPAGAQDNTGSTSKLPGSPADVQETTSPIQEVRTSFGESFRGHWTFTGDASVSQQYDDNAAASSGSRVSGSTSDFSLRFSAGVKKKRLTFQAHYLPQYSVHEKVANRNSLTQQYQQMLEYRLGARTDLNWSASASRIETAGSSPSLLVNFGGLTTPVIYPQGLQQNANILSTASNLGLEHRFSAKSSFNVGVNGGFTEFTSRNNVPLSAILGRKSFSAGGSLGWNYLLTPGKTIGVQVGNTYFGLLDPNSHSNYEYLKVSYQQEFRGGLNLTLGLGPSFRMDQNNLITGSGTLQRSYVLDAAIAKKVRAYLIGVTVQNGAQLGTTQGSLGGFSTALSVSRNFRQHWSGSSSFTYSKQHAIDLSSTESYSVGNSLGYRITPALQLQVTYSYINQGAVQNVPLGNAFDRNLYGMRLAYQFGGGAQAR